MYQISTIFIIQVVEIAESSKKMKIDVASAGFGDFGVSDMNLNTSGLKRHPLFEKYLGISWIRRFWCLRRHPLF